jgi:hypothetical protein
MSRFNASTWIVLVFSKFAHGFTTTLLARSGFPGIRLVGLCSHLYEFDCVKLEVGISLKLSSTFPVLSNNMFNSIPLFARPLLPKLQIA